MQAAVPDNLKAGITRPSRYEPGINRTYQDLADHYGFVVLQAASGRHGCVQAGLMTLVVSAPQPTAPTSTRLSKSGMVRCSEVTFAA